MTDLTVGSENIETVPEVVHATIVSNTHPGWRNLTPEEVAAGVTGNPDDPYDSLGERLEGMFVGQLVSKVLAKFGVIDPDGFCSTYREWHILCRGFHSGFNTELFKKFPKCPDYWNDEAQYYEGGQELGYVVKIVISAVGTAIVGGGFSLAAFTGMIPAGAVGFLQNLTAII